MREKVRLGKAEGGRKGDKNKIRSKTNHESVELL